MARLLPRLPRAAGPRSLALAVLPLTACATSPSPATAAADCAEPEPEPAPACESFDPDQVSAVLERQREAWNSGDLTGFLASYEQTERLLFTSGAKIRRGYDETHAKYLARYGESTETMGTLAFEILDVRGLGECPQAAIVLGRWRLEDTPEAGEGVFSVILERQEGGWVIVHDHTSAAPQGELTAPK
ncbi:nuclear transport factor 2 family protein [Pseudenhygromyxa sp. WMMC2535]|uniref:YybH family protein n=1 Tax=Pseudenhygromyxa sp. WMMC2535 TaxID=2712867 RepID=UPI00155575D8|nr:nuclear transport factor 2 family protein [Pseudenhygromyxa sp. WMMC2535]NVB43059.1 nuclear transport factor 2 family protein [Pseudenhygromyxa sp. WMMC2535]